jgi:uroporphyrinogen decarboxylase
MEPENLKLSYGDKIVFHGGFDTQKKLPNGTPDDIEREVKELIDAMYGGGGYIFAAAHNIQEDVPPENIIAMFRAAREHGKKK